MNFTDKQKISWISFVLSPYGPPGTLEQVHWSAGKADLTWGPFIKVGVLGEFGFRTFSSDGTPNLESTDPELWKK